MPTAQYHPYAVSTLFPYPLTLWNYSSRTVLFGSACSLKIFILLSMDCDLIILSLGVLSLPAQQTRSFHSCLLHLDRFHGCCVSGCIERSMLMLIWKIQTWKIRACLYQQYFDISNETCTINVRRVQQLGVCLDLCRAIAVVLKLEYPVGCIVVSAYISPSFLLNVWQSTLQKRILLRVLLSSETTVSQLPNQQDNLSCF